MFASIALYAGLAAAAVGFVCVIRPMRLLRIRSRRRGINVALAGLALAAAAALAPSGVVRIPSAGGKDEGAIDQLMPEYHFNERHGVQVLASPERVYAAIKQVRPGEIRLFLLLTGIRSLSPARLFGRGVPPVESQPPILDVATGSSFLVLQEDPGREIVLGTCSQFWRLRRRAPCPGVDSPAALRAFAEPGYAKAVINFRIVPEASGCRVTTETRILATDESARRRFAAYWRLIYPGSSLIRYSWLQAIKRRAESPPATRARS